MNTQELAEYNVYSAIGSPNLPVETQITTGDWENTLNRYYTFLPITTTNNFSFNVGSPSFSREQEIAFTAILPRQPSTINPDTNFYYIGMVGYAIRNQLPSPRIDEYLLGFATARPIYDPLSWAYVNTLTDLNTGEFHYEEDFVKETVRIIAPTNGIVEIMWGLGHNDPKKIPRRHIEFISELLKLTYYSRLIAIRKTGKFSESDFTIDTSLLESEYSGAKEKVEKFKVNLGLMTLAKG